MKKEITAEWARKTAETVLSQKAQSQLEDCLNQIEESVNSNELSCTLYFYPERKVVDELEKRGFDVRIKQAMSQMEETSVTINW